MQIDDWLNQCYFFFQNMEDLDIVDDVIKSFYFAQEHPGNTIEQTELHHQQKDNENSRKEQPTKGKAKNKSKSTFKNTLSKLFTMPSSSYVLRKEPGKAHHLIKICIYNLSDSNVISNIDHCDSASVSVQYQVKDNHDEIMDETDYLVSKIVKKLSSASHSF